MFSSQFFASRSLLPLAFFFDDFDEIDDWGLTYLRLSAFGDKFEDEDTICSNVFEFFDDGLARFSRCLQNVKVSEH